MNIRRVTMTKRIAMTGATLLTAGAVGLTGMANAASSSDSASTSARCPDICIAIYKPVTCLMSNGRIRTFANACVAEVFACQHGLTIVRCWPAHG
jgi:hypothetical protein